MDRSEKVESIVVRLKDAVIVVAHPDDEILWFSSILDKCRAVVACFGQSANSDESWNHGRATLMENFPLDKVRFLKVRQSDAYETADWKKPTENDFGLQLRRPSVSYAENAQTLQQLLADELRNETVVFTHNPWGEYGNEEHVQVFKVVERLRQSLGFDLYVNGYVSNRSLKLMSENSGRISGQPLAFKTDVELASALMQKYVQHECWTWLDDYKWPQWELFYQTQPLMEGRVPHAGATASPPLNYLGHDFDKNIIIQMASKMLPKGVKAGVKQFLIRSDR